MNEQKTEEGTMARLGFTRKMTIRTKTVLSKKIKKIRSQQKRVFAEIKQNENNRVGRVEKDKQKIIYNFRLCKRSTRTCLSLS